MKLRKAIKLAAAGVVAGSVPMMAMGAADGLEGSVTFATTTGDGYTVDCTATTYTCDVSNAITDDGFIMFQATDGTNTFYVTGIVDNAEGTFNTLTVVGEETNTNIVGGVWNKTVVNEVGLSDDDFFMDATVTTGGYQDAGLLGGSQKVQIHETIQDNTNSNAFNTGFDYSMGTTSSSHTYEVFDINLNVSDGTASDGINGLMTNTFQMIETKVDGATGANELGAIGKTLLIDQLLDDQADTADTFTQRFIQNEAAGLGVVSEAGTVTAGPNGEASFTFSAGDTLAVKTLSQNMNGAAADFGLSDAADESGTTFQEAGVDNFLGTTGMAGNFNTTAADPFVTFGTY
jgi:hypothetical protein